MDWLLVDQLDDSMVPSMDTRMAEQMDWLKELLMDEKLVA